VIDHHVVPGLGDRQLRTVTAEDVDRFLVDRARQGYSSSTVRRARNTLSQVFRWGVRRRQCTWDPASFAELPPAAVYAEATPRVNRTPRALKPDEARRFITATSGGPHAALLLTAVCTGLRAGELLALHRDDLDLETGVLLVRRAWKGHDEYRHLGEPKTRSSVRTVGLPAVVVESLRRHRTDQQRSRFDRGRPGEWEGLVFTSAAGTPIDPELPATRQGGRRQGRNRAPRAARPAPHCGQPALGRRRPQPRVSGPARPHHHTNGRGPLPTQADRDHRRGHRAHGSAPRR